MLIKRILERMYLLDSKNGKRFERIARSIVMGKKNHIKDNIFGGHKSYV